MSVLQRLKNEKWIDFLSSVNNTFVWGTGDEPKKFGFSYYTDNCDEQALYIGYYRQLIRALDGKFKFEKIIVHKPYKKVMFLTNIPNDVYVDKIGLYNEWRDDCFEITDECDSSDCGCGECGGSSDDESDDESVVVENAPPVCDDPA
jgi:hypothetical protein